MVKLCHTFKLIVLLDIVPSKLMGSIFKNKKIVLINSKYLTSIYLLAGYSVIVVLFLNATD